MTCPQCSDTGLVLDETYEPYGNAQVLRTTLEYCSCETGQSRERMDKYAFDPEEIEE